MIDTADASISNRIYTEEEQQKLYKRTLLIVSISQMFGGAGLAAGITVGALLAQQMLGTDAYAGLPAAMFTMGSAVAAFCWEVIAKVWSPRRACRRFYSRWVRGYWSCDGSFNK